MNNTIKREGELFVCPYCNKTYKALAYHTTQVHNITAKELRRRFGLKSKYQLITDDIKERHRELAISTDEASKLKELGLNTRYVKGHEGHIRKNWSKQALKELSERRNKKG